MGARLTLAGAALFALGILLLGVMLFRTIRRLTYRDKGDPRQGPPGKPGLAILIPALVLIVAAQGFFWLASQLEYFRPMREDGYVGWVRVERRPDAVKSLSIIYTPMAGDSMGVSSSAYLSGDSWRLSGEILNFKFANKYLELPERAYKVTRLRTRYIKQTPEGVPGALLREFNPEGGPSRAAGVFRGGFWGWFASADSFGTDYVTTEEIDEYAVRVRPDESVVLVPQR